MLSPLVLCYHSYCFYVVVQALSCVQLFATPWTVACQAPLHTVSQGLLKFICSYFCRKVLFSEFCMLCDLMRIFFFLNRSGFNMIWLHMKSHMIESKVSNLTQLTQWTRQFLIVGGCPVRCAAAAAKSRLQEEVQKRLWPLPPRCQCNSPSQWRKPKMSPEITKCPWVKKQMRNHIMVITYKQVIFMLLSF